MNKIITKTSKVQYCKTKKSENSLSQNCRIPLTKSIIEDMGFYEGCSADITYDLQNETILIKLNEDV